jgi:DNA-binding transcriptional LysR family regulator
MDLRQLRYFHAVASELSFTKAAEKLNISQPPLSQKIAGLEEELGTRLFVRSSRRVELSEPGKVLLVHVEGILRSIDDARIHVRRVAKGAEGHVNIGLTGSHFLGPFPRFICLFREGQPGVELVLHEMPPTDQIRAVRDGTLDICFERASLTYHDLTADLLWRDRPVAVLPIGHPLSGRKSLHLRELADEDFVSLRVGSSIFQKNLYDACGAAGFEPRVVQQVVEVPAILNLVAAGLGVSVVPMALAMFRSGSVATVSLELPSKGPVLSADVYMIKRKTELRPVVLKFGIALQKWASSQSDAF